MDPKHEIDPVPYILSDVFRLEGFTHNPNEVVVIHSPGRKKHRVNFVVNADIMLHLTAKT